MLKPTSSKSGKSKKSSRPKRDRSESGGVRESISRPVTLVALTMVYSYAVLVVMPAQLSQQQVVLATSVTLLVVGAGVALMMHRRALAVSRNSDSSGFDVLMTGYAGGVMFAAGAVYVYIYGYTGPEVLQVAAACLAIVLASRMSKSGIKTASTRRQSHAEPVRSQAADESAHRTGDLANPYGEAEADQPLAIDDLMGGRDTSFQGGAYTS